MRLPAFALMAALVFISGCATPPKPKFQKGTPGYTVDGSISPQGFTVITDFGSYKDEKYSVLYGHRAVAEECNAKGFPFFDVAVIDSHHFEGYCFKTADHAALAVEFTASGLDARPQHFVVHDLYGKTNSKLEKGDEILLLEGVPVTSVGFVKAAVFRANNNKKTSVKLKIKRGDQELEIQEPIALFKNSALGSTQLDLIRSRVE